ncbi:MAG: V-type ATPase subunit [Oscillospiraceae bacterium]|nr:V-type ATPase subunit [Oscillospiraceae bacterium]
MPKQKDTDFLYISAKVRGMEHKLLKREAYERMILAGDNLEVARILEEHGYGHIDTADTLALHHVILDREAAIFQELAARAPEPEIIDLFRIKDDYHNAKALVRAEAAGLCGKYLMRDGGRIDRELLAEEYQAGFSQTPPILAKAITEARAALARTNDAQVADIVLDKAMFEEWRGIAEELGDDYVRGYVRVLIDDVNRDTVGRTVGMGFGRAKLMDLLIPGGNIAPRTLLEEGALEKVPGDLARAYLQKANLVAFGAAPVIAYLAAVEEEGRAVRTVVAGRIAGLEPTAIRERLRV